MPSGQGTVAEDAMSANRENIRSVIVERRNPWEGGRGGRSRWEMNQGLHGRCWGRGDRNWSLNSWRGQYGGLEGKLRSVGCWRPG